MDVEERTSWMRVGVAFERLIMGLQETSGGQAKARPGERNGGLPILYEGDDLILGTQRDGIVYMMVDSVSDRLEDVSEALEAQGIYIEPRKPSGELKQYVKWMNRSTGARWCADAETVSRVLPGLSRALFSCGEEGVR